MPFAKKFISDEKRANIRKLYAEGMPIEQIHKRLHMRWETVVEIVKDVPDPHGGKAQQIFSGMGQKRAFQRRRAVPNFFFEE